MYRIIFILISIIITPAVVADDKKAQWEIDCVTMFHDSSPAKKKAKKWWVVYTPRKKSDGSYELGWNRVWVNGEMQNQYGIMVKVQAKCWVTPEGAVLKPEIEVKNS